MIHSPQAMISVLLFGNSVMCSWLADKLVGMHEIAGGSLGLSWFGESWTGYSGFGVPGAFGEDLGVWEV